MKKLLFFVFAFLILNSTFSIASPVQLPATGQKDSYAAGDDGALQKGEAWQATRFVDNGDQTQTDTLTNLIWTKDGNAPGPAACNPATTKTWQGALDYVACLNSNSFLGKSDWRLPNRKELMSLLNWGQNNPATWLNIQGFSGVQGSYYWSSSTQAIGTSYAWGVYMGMDYGHVVNSSKGYSNYVWPVRGGQWSLDSLVIYGSFNLGSTNVGQSAAPRVVTLHNAGATSQSVAAINITGGNLYELSIAPGGATPCASLSPTLAAGEKCTLALGFSPASKGNKTANLSINANAQMLNIPISGTAYTTISGTVVDQTSKAAVSGAAVTLTGGATATTDANGAFNFGTALPNGSYSATVSKTGYANTVINGITVTDTKGSQLNVGLIAPGGMNIAAPASLLYGETGKLYDLRLPVSGGTAPFTLSKAYGTLPPGITLDATGFGGVPNTTGNYTFAIAVSDSASGYAEQEFTVTVTAPLTITTNATLPRGVKGNAYSSALNVSGGAAPYTYALASGTLPTGLTLGSSTGVISGTFSADATGAAIGIKVIDSVGRTITKYFSLPVDASLAITTTRLNDAITGGIKSTQTMQPAAVMPPTPGVFSPGSCRPASHSIHPPVLSLAPPPTPPVSRS